MPSGPREACDVYYKVLDRNKNLGHPGEAVKNKRKNPLKNIFLLLSHRASIQNVNMQSY